MSLSIGKYSIDGSQGTFVIAEVAQAHDGSLGYAHSFIDAAVDSGADAVRFHHFAVQIDTPPSSLGIPLQSRLSANHPLI